MPWVDSSYRSIKIGIIQGHKDLHKNGACYESSLERVVEGIVRKIEKTDHMQLG